MAADPEEKGMVEIITAVEDRNENKISFLHYNTSYD